jgi:ribosome-associated toxin RatA of RatAB toxin-antitoxin module
MTEPVRRRHFVPRATPEDLFAVVTDFAAYPRLFPEIQTSRVLRDDGRVARVEFAGAMVLPYRYTVDITRDLQQGTVEWTFVEGQLVTDSVGGWAFVAEGEGTRVDYRVSLDVSAPLPGFMVRRILDGLVSASLPAMLASVEREVRARQAARPSP